MSYDFEKLYISGEWVPSEGGAFLEVENPANLEIFSRVPDAVLMDVDRAARAAAAAQPSWAAVPQAGRADMMQAMLDIFRTHHDEIIRLEALELGAPTSFSRVSHCEYQFTRIASYIDAARSMVLEKPFALSTVLREPMGVVSCITPWNYPLGQVVQKVIPAILTGNTVVLKPSQHTPLTAYLLADAFDRSGFPPGVFNLLTGRGSALGNALVTHPAVDMVSFTGSTQVGISISRLAAEKVRRVSLELGGKSPCLWMPADDYSPRVDRLFQSIFLNSGQTCTSLSRLLVPARDLGKIEELLAARVGELRVGDPFDPDVRIGPVASRGQYRKICEYIRIGLAEGARMIAGEVPGPAGKGYFIKPVIFSGVNNGMRIAREEIFGPVLCIIPYETLEEAVEIANDTPYGLSAAVWGPHEQAAAIARRIRSGNVYVNDAPRDVTAPFGGYKQSGIGREGGIAGLVEFTQLKTVFDHGTRY